MTWVYGLGTLVHSVLKLTAGFVLLAIAIVAFKLIAAKASRNNGAGQARQRLDAECLARFRAGEYGAWKEMTVAQLCGLLERDIREYNYTDDEMVRMLKERILRPDGPPG